MTLLVLRGAVIARCGIGGLVDFGEVEAEVWSDVGVELIDATVDDGDADAFAHGGVPGAVNGTAGYVVAVASDLLDCPGLRCLVEGVVRRWWGRRWWGECGGEGAVRGKFPDWNTGCGGLRRSIDANRCGSAFNTEAMCRNDAVVEDVCDIGQRCEAAQCHGVV